MNSLGEYCSFCERPLPDESFVWHKGQRTTVTGPSPYSEWPKILLACRNCAESATANGDVDGIRLLYPDDPPWYSPISLPPFTYELKEVTIVEVDAQGSSLTSRRASQVVIEGQTEEAMQTVLYFKLNTPYYDRQSETIRIPRAELLAQNDVRLEKRTSVYHSAVELSVQLEKHPDLRKYAVGVARQLISSSGFWSVWVTALWQHTRDLELLRELLLRIR